MSRAETLRIDDQRTTTLHTVQNTANMIRAINIVLLLEILSLTLGFGVIGTIKTRTFARPTLVLAEKISWSDYKHDYVDPITPHETASKVRDHMDPAKRAIADEYWLLQFEKDKEKLHQYMMAEASPAETLSEESETWSHYKHAYIDPITPHETASKNKNHMDPAKRASADKYWLQKFLEDKEKLHHSAQSHQV